MFKLKAQYLLLVAAFVWLLAGINIVRLGLVAISEHSTPIFILVVGIPLVFILFHRMFSSLVGKHSTRIREYNNKPMYFWYFFDPKGYIMMAIMMGGGIALRSFGIVPTWFVAFFYTGLGCALALAGIGFLLHFIKRGGQLVCPVTKKTRLA